MLNRYVKMQLDQDPLLNRIWVLGEISNFKRHSSGHLYFTLKDETGAIPAVMFYQDARRLKFSPASGDKVQALGQVSLYEKTGTYQLYVREMEMDGVGLLYQAFEELKQKLKDEGLFDAAYKKPIPAFPRAVGIVTSPTGAAVRDICQIAKRRFPGVRLILYPALVQGDGAARTIVRGIRTLDAMPEVDTIIIGRGGGSIEDLWPFNEEIVARCIFDCETPVISAVGHETDFTIADFVADLRAPTPSAAAELAVPDVESILNGLESGSKHRLHALRAVVEERKNAVETLSMRLSMRSPFVFVRDRLLEVDSGAEKRSMLMRQFLDAKLGTLDVLSKSLELSSPLVPLSKGYALIERPDGTLVVNASSVVEKDELEAVFADGRVNVKVTGVSAGTKAD